MLPLFGSRIILIHRLRNCGIPAWTLITEALREAILWFVRPTICRYIRSIGRGDDGPPPTSEDTITIRVGPWLLRRLKISLSLSVTLVSRSSSPEDCKDSIKTASHWLIESIKICGQGGWRDRASPRARAKSLPTCRFSHAAGRNSWSAAIRFLKVGSS